MKHPSEVVPQHIVLWRDRLRSRKKSAATGAFKLSVLRSFFEYLKASGAVTLKLASTKLVSPPELPSKPTGRALSAKEVRYLLLEPNREKAEGTRLRANVRHAAALFARLGGLFLAGLVGEMELRAVDAALQGQGGRGEVWPLPKEVKEAIESYLRRTGSGRM